MSIERKIASFKDYRIQLNLVFRYAKKNNYIKSNPMDEVVYPVLEEEHPAENSSEKIKFWDRQKLNKFLQFAKNELLYRQYAMFRLRKI